EGLARGFITPTQARAAGAEAAQNFNQGVLLTMDRASASGGLNVGSSRIYRELATSFKNVEQEATNAVAGVGRIRQGLVSLAAQATGTIPVLDRIGASLLSMGTGGTVAIGVIA